MKTNKFPFYPETRCYDSPYIDRLKVTTKELKLNKSTPQCTRDVQTEDIAGMWATSDTQNVAYTIDSPLY